MLGWLHVPDGPITSAVVVVPSLGYEYWSAHQTLRRLADGLADDGHLVLRFDPTGMGDAGGEHAALRSTEPWEDDVALAIAEVRRAGAASVVVVGLRAGAFLAIRGGEAAGVDGLVLWAPPPDGRRYVRELRLVASPAPEGSTAEAGTLHSAGVAFSAELLASIGRLPGDPHWAGSAPQVLVVERSDRPGSDPLLHALERSGCRAEVVRLDDAAMFLDVPTEYASTPDAHVAAIRTWCRRFRDIDGSPGRPFDEALIEPEWVHGDVREQVVELGPRHIVGVEALPIDGARPDALTVVFLNSGSEHHVGPGRAWVDFARHIAAHGDRALRVDFRGWGESPDDGFAPARPFAAHALEDLDDTVAAMRERSTAPVVLLGLCAGAWTALRRAPLLQVAGVIAFNPPIDWEPGDPIDATVAESRARREREHPHDAALARWRWWDLLDVLRWPVKGRRWLDTMSRSEVPLHLVYAHDDDGLEYADTCLARAMRRAERGAVHLVRMQRVDHSFHRVWERDEPVAVLSRLLDELRTSSAAR